MSDNDRGDAPHARIPTIDAVSVGDAWRELAGHTDVHLIDVRTRAEWSFVGLPDLSSISKQPILIEWQSFPTGERDADFVAKLSELLAAQGATRSSRLLFLCRSGGRSLSAATAMAEAGYDNCVNVVEGFEGPLDSNRRRGTEAGWKAAGLPWMQS